MQRVLSLALKGQIMVILSSKEPISDMMVYYRCDKRKQLFPAYQGFVAVVSKFSAHRMRKISYSR